MLHVNVDSLMNAVVLKRTNHFQSRAIAHVGEPGIFMATEISLQNPPILRAVEDSAPRFKFANAIWRLFRVQLGHPPTVHVLAAAHRVGKMHFPIIALIDIGERGCNAALRHDGMRFSQQRFANKANANSRPARKPAPPAPMISTSCSKVS